MSPHVLAIFARQLRSLRWGSRLPLLASAAAAVGAIAGGAYVLQLLATGGARGANASETLTVTLVDILLVTLHQPRSVALWVMLACFALALACAALAWRIVLRASGSAGACQMAGLLAAVACMLDLRVIPTLMQAFNKEHSAAFQFQNALGIALASYIVFGAARFLSVFPRAVDAESVEAGYVARRPIARWLDRTGPAVERINLRRAWHRELVHGRAVWVLSLLPLLLFALSLPAAGPADQGWWLGVEVILLPIIGAFYFFFALPFARESIAHVGRYGTQDERARVALLRSMILVLVIVLATAALTLPLLVMLDAASAPKIVPAKPALPEFGWHERALVANVLFWLFLPEWIVLAAAVAVMRGGALDARVAFTRATLWWVVGVVLTLVFILAERFLALQVTRWFALESQSSTLLAGAFVAASFMPMRKAAGRMVDAIAQRIIPLHEAAKGERLPLAVAVVDMSGYTALSARDESQAILQGAALTRACEQVAAEHGGRRVKGLGDAALLVFAHPARAAAALPVIHRRFAEMVRTLGVDPLPLHSGLHYGEVVQAADGDVFGQTVNIASRLVNAAQPGQILATAAACAVSAARERPPSAGVHRFKNVPDPVECFALA